MSDYPLHPQFKKSNIKGLTKNQSHFDSEIFQQKFNLSLVKLLELKGISLVKEASYSDSLFSPELESPMTEILVFHIVHEQKNFGLLYLEKYFLSLLIHKLLGGSDKSAADLVKLPLGKIEAKALESTFGILSLSLREGLKHAFSLKEIDHLQIQGPLNEFEFPHHLERTQKVIQEELIYKRTSFEDYRMKVVVLLNQTFL